MRIFECDDVSPEDGAIGGTALLAAPPISAPFRLVAPVGDPIKERFIRILEVDSDRDVTVIEFVSPTNKRNPGLPEFREKRFELLQAGVNVVEIDLVRSGNWRRLMLPHESADVPATTYRGGRAGGE